MIALKKGDSTVTAPYSDSSYLSGQMRRFLAGATVSLFTIFFLIIYLAPFAYMVVTSLKTLGQIQNGRILPSSEAAFQYEGQAYSVYNVPTADGMQEWALVQPGREASQFIDPANPAAGPITWEGRWRTLDPVWEVNVQWDNYSTAWRLIKFPRLLWNTFAIAVLGTIGTLLSCIAVAYGFARFPIPGKNVIFMVLIGTIILPQQVTLVPTYALFERIGWTGTWLPLIVPHFFANAYNVFLLRQFFLTIPRDLDEAAMIDGAGPFRILISIILPQAWPAITAVAIFHFIFAWNDYFLPLIYLLGKPELHPISVGVQEFNFIYGTQGHLLQATSMLALVIPVVIFFLAQRVFMRGVVITGVDK
jgi:multiple sugar transport system permease protein